LRLRRPKGSSEWLEGDRALIEYPYIRRQLAKKLPVSLQLHPRKPVVEKYEYLEQQLQASHGRQIHVDAPYYILYG
jgi:hypothetical protein